MLNVYKKLGRITADLGSEEKIGNFASLQNNYVHILLNINKEMQSANTHIQNAIIIQMRTSEMEKAISDILEIAIRLSGEMSSSTHISDRGMLKQIAQLALDEIKGRLNSHIGSVYIFSGSMVNTPTVGDITETDFYYRGDNVIQSVQVDEMINLEYGITGDNEAFQQLIVGTNLVVRSGDKLLNEAKSWVEKAIPNLINLQQKVRNSYMSATRYRELHEEAKLELINMHRTLEESYGLDIPQLISEFSINESILQSSQFMLSKLMNLTLANSLK
ncbi:MAG: hypothetical protein HRK26_02240 [Rickettsiaceae bacterium H1]|nr:hypothetical protein [Rickettsiaceae bacterium H1]